MHKNTYLLATVLAIITALVIGVNIGKKIPNQSQPTNNEQPDLVSLTPSPTIPTSILKNYENSECGFSFSYPDNLTRLDSTMSNAVFADLKQPGDTIIVLCQETIPEPAAKAQAMTITYDKGASISAMRYEESDNEKVIESILFNHPDNGMAILITGQGETFEQILRTLNVF